MHWIKTRMLSSVDQILNLLAISRTGLIWVMAIHWFRTLHHPPLLMAETQVRIFASAWVLSNHFGVWFATILSIFYLFRIASFSNPTFLYLKWRVKKVILMIQLGTLIFLCLNLLAINIYVSDWIHQYEGNATWDSRVSGFSTLSQLSLLTMTIFSLMPFTAALISFFLLIFSLWKHLQRIKSNSKGHRDPRTEAHINALKTVTSFLLLHVSFFLCLMVASIPSIHQDPLLHSVCQTLAMIYPSGHSFILILGNPKLRQTLFLMLQQLWCGLKGTPNSVNHSDHRLTSVPDF